ncbi:type I-B CRISPR-associated protein Cas5b [Salegentibacter sp. F188]|uniref:Type I-B CRISPR-associated protein Cas5b n=1 Tax=Autumnicola patrickiae TaxID=3075591 RepID=A0ABU3E1C6_9FLAO|nr:type I-B CRISPR-associated protein Cas5b [Salegentibacter sp. F188]MDT0689725.1 type I-B CRISPR-associated protein Cas5b [Salegentibacter sp. F188]
MKLISIDLKADFGFFRKPDTNNTINLSYNLIHRPAVLGILGAILGLEGYRKKGKLPQYYQLLKDLKIGIRPLNDEKGNFLKTNIKYSNTVGYANKGSNFLTEELTLIAPAYRIFILLDETKELEQKLYDYLKEAKAEFIPYFGKNEFTASWLKSSFQDYTFEKTNKKQTENFTILTVFKKDDSLKDKSAAPEVDLLNYESREEPFLYFERLPEDFDLELMQYRLGEFAFTNYAVLNSFSLDDLYQLNESNDYVQLI